MKIRTDYVTNSSSSSYVISYSSIPEFDAETVEKYPCVQVLRPLIEAIMFCEDDYGDTTAGETVTTIEELDNFLISERGWGEYNTIEKLIEECDIGEGEYEAYTDEINAGHSLLFKSVGYSDTSLVGLLKELEKCDAGIKILFGD